MKNVLIYNIVDNKKRYDNELLFNYFRAQVDNSIRLGWDREDIIIGTNFSGCCLSPITFIVWVINIGILYVF